MRLLEATYNYFAIKSYIRDTSVDFNSKVFEIDVIDSNYY